jgi:hypothetical protein
MFNGTDCGSSYNTNYGNGEDNEHDADVYTHDAYVGYGQFGYADW